MRRFEAVWEWNGTTLTDRTSALGNGTASVTLTTGRSLYFGTEDWLAGLYTEVSAFSGQAIVVEQHTDGSWKELPQQETYTNDAIGYTLQPQSYQFDRHGMYFWKKSPWVHMTFTPTATFPETAAPPDTEERYWYRARCTAGSVTVTRALPRHYNSYSDPTTVANFLQIPEFSDRTSPDIDSVRRFIADSEDWLDVHTLKSWRLGAATNETYDFNPNGIFLRHRPAHLISSLRIWNGSTFEVFQQGRGKDFWLDPRLGQIVFTLPSFRMRQYSHVLSRYMRQPGSVQVDYVYGRDFQTDPQSDLVAGIVNRRTAAQLIEQADWTALLTSGGGLDNLPKPEKVRQWKDEAQQKADELRGLITF